MNRLLFTLALGFICIQTATAGSSVSSLSNGKTGSISFKSIPAISMNQFLAGNAGKKSTVISGTLDLPNNVETPVPAVVILHGAGGIHSNEKKWASRLRKIGIATFLLNSNKRPECRNFTCYDSNQGMVNMVDAYRALTLLASHPLIDQKRIAVLGFSVGGKASLYSSVNRFQQLWNTSGIEFAAYLSFYPACNIRFEKDMDISDNPIRIFHGALDEWASPLACQEYVDLLIASGKDIGIIIYENAHHAFDASREQGMPSVVSGHFHRKCRFTQNSKWGEVVQNGYPENWSRKGDGWFLIHNPSCFTRKARIKSNPVAAKQAIQAVTEFLAKTFSIDLSNLPAATSSTKSGDKKKSSTERD